MYLQASIGCKTAIPEAVDIITALLGEFPFHTFSEEEGKVLAYGETKDFNDALKKEIEERVSDFSEEVEFTEVEKVNWNEEWEKNYFQPIWIENEICVFAPFHTLDKEPKIPIIIEPKMSFGTGHHSTTHLMCASILRDRAQIQDASVLDMGSGTGILAILAAKLGASFVHAIDIEEWCKDNAIENFERNDVTHFQSDMGDVKLLKSVKENYKIIFANIQRNVLLQDMEAYLKVLDADGYLYISGFPPSDAAQLITHAEGLGLKHLYTDVLGDWCAVSFKN